MGLYVFSNVIFYDVLKFIYKVFDINIFFYVDCIGEMN